MPLDQGGWRGCYCSSHCMEHEITESEGDDTDIGKLHLELIWVFHGAYQAYGIYERFPDEGDESDEAD
jgi:hypothetical protein